MATDQEFSNAVQTAVANYCRAYIQDKLDTLIEHQFDQEVKRAVKEQIEKIAKEARLEGANTLALRIVEAIAAIKV
jgi:hypothetical protein